MRTDLEVYQEIAKLCSAFDIQNPLMFELERAGEAGYLVTLRLPPGFSPDGVEFERIRQEISSVPEVSRVYLQLAERPANKEENN